MKMTRLAARVARYSKQQRAKRIMAMLKSVYFMEIQDPVREIKTVAIEPWERLNRALAEQKALETSKSDEARDAGRLALAIRSLAADLGLDVRDLAASSTDWSLLSAVADASKNRLLSSASRRTTLAVSAHFETDGKGRYRFINNRIMIVHPATGSVDFMPTAANAIQFLIAKLELDIDWTPNILEGPPKFGPSVELDAGPDPDKVIEMLQVRFLKQDPDGELVMFQPKEWQLELKSNGRI